MVSGSNMNSMTSLNVEAGYINYCYTQQCIDTTKAPVSLKEEGKEGRGLADSWAQRPQEPPVPHGKVAVCRRWRDAWCVCMCCALDVNVRAAHVGGRRAAGARAPCPLGDEKQGNGEEKKQRNWPLLSATAHALQGFR